MEQVLNSGYIYHHSVTIIRTIVAIRLDCFPVLTVADVQRRVTCEALLERRVRKTHDKHCYRSNRHHGPGDIYCFADDRLCYPVVRDDYPPVDDAFLPDRFPAMTTATVLRGVLLLARRVSFLTLGCLDRCIQSFRQSTPMVLQHFTDDNDSWADLSGLSIRQLREETPKLAMSSPPDFGNPQWQEEQIIYLGVWRLQLIRELKIATSCRALSGWTEAEILKLDAMDVVDVYRFQEMAEIMSDASGWRDLHLSHVEMTEHSAVLLAMNYSHEARATVIPKDWYRPWPAPQLDPGGFQVYRREDNYIEKWNIAAQNYGRMFMPCPENVIPSFTRYRQLGLTIWSSSRLYAHGFHTVYTFDRHQDRLPLLTWISVLPEQDIVKVEEWEDIVNLEEEENDR
ncbi:hypothetical protein ANO11243_003620 [Dothideomycetidae sp. 11243]|nr:hypothetical protein ANO11243_003620 [fungal sp. No.11243]